MVRLAMIYALLDRASVVHVGHLAAARAVWEYVERTVTWLFGRSTGNADADAVLRMLRNDDGETAGQVSRLEVRAETWVRTSAGLDEIERVLRMTGLVETVDISTDRVDGRRGGRKRRVLRLTAMGRAEVSKWGINVS